MAPPYHFSTIEEVYAKGGWNLHTHDGCGIFTEACVAALNRRDAKWGFLKKVPPQNNYNGHSVDGALYLDTTPGQSTHVDFIAFSEDPRANIAWQPDIPRYSQADWYAPEITTPTLTLPGVSLFWAYQGYNTFFPQFKRVVDFAMRFGAKVARWFFTVGGDLFEGYDPWVNMGVWLDDSMHHQKCLETARYLYEYGGMTSHIVMVGGTAQYIKFGPDRLTTEFSNLILNSPHLFELGETANEYRTNNFGLAQVLAMTKAIRSKVGPDIRLAHSSPNSIHAGGTDQEIQDEVRAMYKEDWGANAITTHWNRDRHIPPTLGPYAPALRYCSEPRGYGASGPQPKSVEDLFSDFKSAIRQGYRGYWSHWDVGVFGGRCHQFFKDKYGLDKYPTFDNRPFAAEAAAGIKAISLGHDPIPQPGEPTMPLPDRGEMMDENRLLHEYYSSERGLRRPSGLWIDGHPDYEGQGAWLFDVYLNCRIKGWSREKSRQAYIAEIENSPGGEWQQRHPGETPTPRPE